MAKKQTEELDVAQRVLTETGYELVNAEKLDRVVNGVLGKDGALIGGIGNDASTEDILATYDRMGGLIRRNGDTVATGSFYDFKLKKAHKEPQVVFEYRVNGKVVRVPDGEELPGIVKAARTLAKEEEEAEEKPVRGKRKK